MRISDVRRRMVDLNAFERVVSTSGSRAPNLDMS
jgi:hypothetical protein